MRYDEKDDWDYAWDIYADFACDDYTDWKEESVDKTNEGSEWGWVR